MPAYPHFRIPQMLSISLLIFLMSTVLSSQADAGRFVGLGFADVRGVSADGSVAVGGDEAKRWTASTGAVDLGDLPGGRFASFSNAVSKDGLVVVGRASSDESGSDPRFDEAFRWTTAGMVGLGDLPGDPFDSIAHGVSGDGSVVVGEGRRVATGSEAFRWTTLGNGGSGRPPRWK